MNNPIVDKEIERIIASGNLDFRNKKLAGGDFRGRQLVNAKFTGAAVQFADFTDANMTYADCERMDAFGAKFVNTNLHRANFKEANIASAEWNPSDCIGVTITLQCKSFQDLVVAPGYWYGWAMYLLLMKPPSKEAEEAVIKMMGIERYRVLRDQYTRRII